MKTLFTRISLFVLCLFCSCFPTPSPAQTPANPLSYTAFYDFTSHKPVAGLTLTGYQIPNFAFKGWSLDLDAFGGATLGTGQLTGGPAIALSKSFDAFGIKNILFNIGGGDALFQGHAGHLVGFVGVKVPASF